VRQVSQLRARVFRSRFRTGAAPPYSTVTNANGVAVLENLRFDNRPGQYSITASVAGAGSVVFSAFSIGGKLVATYDLQKMGGEGPPFSLGGPTSVSGGHYQLFDDGTFRQGYDSDGQTSWSSRLPFIRRSQGQIEFYLNASTAPASSFYASRNYLFAVGTLTGDAMTVAYQDTFDFEGEDYSLAK
ncbi:MAG: hypothetical protein JWP08_1716, partial [Bryobacterales bacterium]|nr:hypothetical protein [Bryobacterales bacterium]